MTSRRNFFSNCAVATLMLLSASFPASFANSFSYTLDSIKSLGLPVITIETLDGEEPTCEYIDPPPQGWKATESETRQRYQDG